MAAWKGKKKLQLGRPLERQPVGGAHLLANFLAELETRPNSPHSNLQRKANILNYSLPSNSAPD